MNDVKVATHEKIEDVGIQRYLTPGDILFAISMRQMKPNKSDQFIKADKGIEEVHEG